MTGRDAAHILRWLHTSIENQRELEARFGAGRPVRIEISHTLVELVTEALEEAAERLDPDMPAVMRDAPSWAVPEEE